MHHMLISKDYTRVPNTTCYHQNRGVDVEHVTMVSADPLNDREIRDIHMYLPMGKRLLFECFIFDIFWFIVETHKS